jgi:tetratricopeptide (TPR) repeat protein
MDPSRIDSLVHRLVDDPHDEEALAFAHQAGASDPKSYALLLERVGLETRDSGYASHWLSEAAHVWSTTLGDAHRAARVLMQAIERDPTQRTAADRLAQLYRDKSDFKALVALLERRAKALAGVVPQTAEIRTELIEMYEELGRLWNDHLQQPKKAQESLRRALELSDPARHSMLLRDEIAAQRAAGDLAGATLSLARARESNPQDATLQQEYGALIVERISAGEAVPEGERALGAGLLAGLAEVYDGEHGLAYSAGALDIEPGHDRAMQLYAYYAQAISREDEVALRYLAYIQANPGGAMAAEARWLLAGSYEAARQAENAIAVLEPLRAAGDGDATAKLRELYAQIGRPMPDASPVSEPPTATDANAGATASRRAAASAQRTNAAIDAAQAFATAGKRPDAYKKYREVLEADPVHPEALSWVQDYLRTKREYAALRDVLLAAVRASGESVEARRDRLREVAGICESNLRDTEGAIAAWKQLLAMDRTDDSARQSLTRTLERTQRWDELANLYEQEENVESDLEKKLALQKKLAALHEGKRKDLAAAAEVWERIAALTPEDDHAIATASKILAKIGATARAAQVIASNAPSVPDLASRSGLFERLGELYEELDDPSRAGDAYADAAEGSAKSGKAWEAAEGCFVAAERWDRAGYAAVQRAELEKDATSKARHFARSADYLSRAADEPGALANLVQAADLDPTNEQYAQQLTDRYAASMHWDDLVQIVLRRAEHATDAKKRSELRRQAADLYANQIGDKDAARETWRRLLEDGDDEEAIEHLIDDAVERGDHAEAVEMFHRLEKAATTSADKARVALREAELIADSVGDVEAGIARYERILKELDPSCRLALQAIADLQEARDKPADAANALERELKLVVDPTERAPIATRLARLYEQLDDTDATIRALEVVRSADPDDFDALVHLSDLCETTEKWDKLAELLAQRVEVEGDEVEAALLTRKLSGVLADKLNRGDEALAALTEMADQGDDGVRAAYIELGDRLGWRGIVATKIVEWWIDAKQSSERTSQLRGAFERFAEVGRDDDAVKIACEIVKSKGADEDLADHLEKLAIKTRNLDALSTAHDLIARDVSGVERARELVRQAEVRVPAGSPALEAIHHGEVGLTSVPPAEAEELLSRLAALAEKPEDVVDLYERQVTRCKNPADRVAALGRAAQIAAARGQVTRARGFFDLALSGTPSEEAVAVLEQAARTGDEETHGDALRRALCGALEQGGQGARDGGRTRGGLMRRAAAITYRELGDIDHAFALLLSALIAHVDPLTLDALEALGRELGEPRRAETALSQALEEVFDGPLVRLLLARRAKLRREDLADPAGAAGDLKKLHDLSPNDAAVMAELTTLLTELGDYRAMVRVFEDQILRGKDMSARAELARDVARMWEKELADPREAADAWRRVLRMKQGDAEATAGLERAKANMLQTLDGAAAAESASPEPSPLPARAPAPPAVVAAHDDEDDSPHDDAEDSSIDAAPIERTDVELRSASTEAAHEYEPSRPDAGDTAEYDRQSAELSSVDALVDSVTVDFAEVTLPTGAGQSVQLPSPDELTVDVDTPDDEPPVDEELLLDELTEVAAEEPPRSGDTERQEPSQNPADAKRSRPPPLPRGG